MGQAVKSDIGAANDAVSKFWGVDTGSFRGSKGMGVIKPNIALVNEDISASFNQQDYNFGKNFVDLVSDDQQYNWQVVCTFSS